MNAGINVRDLQQASLRQQVAVVPQDTVLFNDTVFNNIAYGRPGADPADVISAAGGSWVRPRGTKTST